MPKNQKINNSKRYGIWAWVGTKTRTTIDLLFSQFTESEVEASSNVLSLVLNKDAISELKNYLLRKDFDEIYDDLFNNLLINLECIYLPNTVKWSWLLNQENKVKDFMMRQLNIPEALDSILNLKIPKKIIEKGDEN